MKRVIEFTQGKTIVLLGFYKIDTKISFADQVENAREPLNTTLPKIIHMTWLGSTLPVHKFSQNIHSYANLNPDYDIYLWLDHQAPKYFARPGNVQIKYVEDENWSTQPMMDEATNWAMKSDILRLEIVLKYGGIYTDIDTRAYRSFGELTHKIISSIGLILYEYLK